MLVRDLASQSVLVMVFIPKLTGGFRPIGLLPCCLRLWFRVRAVLHKEWEASHCRPFIVGIREANWDKASADEEAVATGKFSGSVLLGLCEGLREAL